MLFSISLLLAHDFYEKRCPQLWYWKQNCVLSLFKLSAIRWPTKETEMNRKWRKQICKGTCYTSKMGRGLIGQLIPVIFQGVDEGESGGEMWVGRLMVIEVRHYPGSQSSDVTRWRLRFSKGGGCVILKVSVWQMVVLYLRFDKGSDVALGSLKPNPMKGGGGVERWTAPRKIKT